MTERAWREWIPKWAVREDGTPLITGRHEVRDGSEEQRVEMRCLDCNAEHVAVCQSGNPRTHIAVFAAVHRAEHVVRARSTSTPG